MAQTHFLAIPNKDLISSFSFNYYGTRLAVSSLDHHLYLLSSDLDTGRWPDDQSASTQISSIPNHNHHQDQNQNQNQNQSTGSSSSSSKQQLPHIQAWTAHEGPVIKVVWSDPIHGELLASAGTDGTVRIWEEDTRPIDHSRIQAPAVSNPKHKSNNSKHATNLSTTGWYQQTILADSTRAIRDIGFSPSENSLKLASISTDDHLRVYECLETSSFSTDNWNLIINIDLSVLPIYPSHSSDHLNPNPALVGSTGGPPGTGSAGTGFPQHPSFTSVRGFEPSSGLNHHPHQKNSASSSAAATTTTTTNFNLINPLSGLRSSATSNLPSSFNNPNPGGPAHHPTVDNNAPRLESLGGWALSWCPETYWGDVLAASSGSNGLIRLIKLSAHSQWENFGILNPATPSKTASSSSLLTKETPSSLTTNPAKPSTTTTSSKGPSSAISSLAWAPPCGRDYHLIAAGHRDGRARIWKLTPPALDPLFSHQQQSTQAGANWTFELDTELEDHVCKPSAASELPSSSAIQPHLTSTAPLHDGGVGKCDWNVTGTVLSTSGSDGKVRIWKMGYTSRWVNTTEINCVDDDDDHRTSSTGITVG